MKKFSTWKLIRKIQRIWICHPLTCHMLLAWWTCNLPLRFICLTDARSRENIPRYFPAPTATCSTAVDHLGIAYSHVMICDYFCCHVFIYFFPLFFPGRSRHWRGPWGLLHHRQLFFSDKASRQAKPPWSCLYRLFLLSYACIRIATVIVPILPILMHSLFFCNCCWYHSCYPKCLV